MNRLCQVLDCVPADSLTYEKTAGAKSAGRKGAEIEVVEKSIRLRESAGPICGNILLKGKGHMSVRIEPLLTIADLESMPDDDNRYELIEGELIVSRAPSLLHQIVVRNFSTFLQNFVDASPIGLVVPGPGVIFSEHNSVIPDVVFVSNERRSEVASGDRITGAPDLVIEVVSPGKENHRREQLAKRQLYGGYGVKEYWIADFETRTIEVYRLRKNVLTTIATLTERDELTSSVLSGFSVPVASIFAF